MNHPFCEGTLSCSFNKLLLNPPTLNKNIWIKSSFYAASKFISTPLLPWHLENIADSLTMTNINYCLFFETQIFIPLDHRAVYFPKSFPKLCYKRLFMYEVKYGNTGLFLSLSRAHTHTNWCDLMVTDSTVELSSGLQCWSPTTSGSQYFPSLHYCSPESSWICFIGFLSIPLWVDCVGWTRLQESEQF